ncbi:MAG: hypothetical protein AMXMBFR36_14660 [Acidobacteriota bacterium]
MSHSSSRSAACRRLRRLLLAAVLLPGPTAAAESFAVRAQAIDGPAVVAAVAPGPIRVGRGTLTPASGARLWLLAAGETPCALWLDGGGTFVYEVDDPAVRSVARKNLKGSTSLRVEESGGRVTVREAVRGAVVWGWQLAGGAQRTGEAVSVPEFPGWARETLEKRLFPPPSMTLIEAAGNGADGVLWALLDGEKETLIVTVDPRPSVATERLLATWKLPPLYRDYAGRHYPLDMAEQPIGREIGADRPAELVARHFDVEVTQTGERTVRVRSTVEIEAQRAGLSVWPAELIDETSEDGRTYPVRVVSAAVDGKAADAIFRDGRLLVDLGRVLAAGGKASVEVVSEGELAVRPNKDSFWILGTGPWYPVPIDYRDIRAGYDLTIDVAGPWIPYASGTTVSRESKDGRNRLVSRLPAPMRFPVVTVGRYSETSDVVDGVRVNVASYAFEKPEEAGRLIQNFGVLRQCLEKLYGVPYPFEEVDILEVNSWGFGQAPAGVILVTREAFTKAGMVLAFGESSVGVNQLISHEVAHAYWGHVVKWDDDADQWLSESFADYTAGLCLQMAAGDERKGKREFDRMVHEWRGQAAKIRAGVTVATANQLAGKDDVDFADRYFTLYARGPLVLHAIREELARMRGSAEEGDRYFAAFLRAIVKNFAFDAPTTRDLEGILDQITKQPWRPFFDRYVYGDETPKVR